MWPLKFVNQVQFRLLHRSHWFSKMLHKIGRARFNNSGFISTRGQQKEYKEQPKESMKTSKLHKLASNGEVEQWFDSFKCSYSNSDLNLSFPFLFTKFRERRSAEYVLLQILSTNSSGKTSFFWTLSSLSTSRHYILMAKTTGWRHMTSLPGVCIIVWRGSSEIDKAFFYFSGNISFTSSRGEEVSTIFQPAISGLSKHISF